MSNSSSTKNPVSGSFFYCKVQLLLAVVTLFSLTWFVYSPGLSGVFLFDDFSNLPPIGDYGPIHTFWQAIAWITSGFAGPTGRPIALASFLIDTRTWPAPPEAFKSTNVLIHLIAGFMLGGLLHALARGLGVSSKRAAWVGVLGAGIWVLHPLWVSTTLYIIQRMALLAALFVFAGLWAYAYGRLRLQAGKRLSGFLWMSSGLGLGTILAVLSKENGALLPLLAWGIEAFVFDQEGRAREQEGRMFVWWRRIFVLLPSFAVLGYLASQLPMLFSGQDYGRSFTPLERLMTETRIVWTYLGDLWLPGLHDGGLFNDDITVSTRLWRPLSTAFATLGVGGLLFLALKWRRSSAILLRASGLAIVFYFVGQLLESTWLSLELIFEHRNYLPAGLMFFPLALFLEGRAQRQNRWPIWVAVAIMSALALLTFKRADLWGKPFLQALTWAHEHPDSARAQSYLANFWEQTGNYPEAERLLDDALKNHPYDLLVLANRALLACDTNHAPGGLGGQLMQLARTGGLAQNVVGYQFDTFLGRLQADCRVFGVGFGFKLIDAALKNPRVLDAPNEQRSLLHRRALYWLRSNDVDKAYEDMLTALRLPGLRPGTRLLFAAELATAGQQMAALRLLDAVPTPLAHIRGWSMPALHERWLRHEGYYRKAETHLRKELAKDMATKSDGAR